MNSRHSSRRRHSGRSARLRPVAILAASALHALSGSGYTGPLTLQPNDDSQSSQPHTQRFTSAMNKSTVAPHFHFRDGILHVEDCSVKYLAEQYCTPLYVYSRAAI